MSEGTVVVDYLEMIKELQRRVTKLEQNVGHEQTQRVLDAHERIR